MDKFVVRTSTSLPSLPPLNEELFKLICKDKKVNSDNKIEIWKKLAPQWQLAKYNNLEPLDCGCSKRMVAHLTNKVDHMRVCDSCIYLFPDVATIYTNIDHIVSSIMDDLIFYKINFELLGFLGLDHDTVDKYNKNGCKNRRNIKIYMILDKVGQYHHQYKVFQEKLNSIYTKISRNIDTHEILEKINKHLDLIHYCDKCEPLNQCQSCFNKNNEHLIGITDEQLTSLWKVYRHIFTDKKLKYGLYGSAGTGKTTLIKYILQIKNLNEMFVLKELGDIFDLDYKERERHEIMIEEKLEEFDKHIDSKKIHGIIVEALYNEKTIVLASPTNKALDVIKEKINSVSEFALSDSFTGQISKMKIILFTISKLLTYRRHLDRSHQMYFKRSHKYINIIDKYSLVIIDESSMICKENIDDIVSDITKSDDLYKKGFILFTGDRAQLPPPKERQSAVFKLSMFKTELQTVMRTDKKNIIELSKFIRQWLTKPKDNVRHELMSHRCEYIKFYTNKNKFIDDFCMTMDAIVLVWTNKTKDEYNKMVRIKLFGNITKKKYMVNEHLIFNNFYKLVTKNNDERVFYSSMPIIVREIDIDPTFICERLDLDIIMERVNDKMRLDSNLFSLYNEGLYKNAYSYVNKFVMMFNKSMNNIFKVWVLYFLYKGFAEKYPIYVIYNPTVYQRSIGQGRRYIKEYFDKGNKLVFDEARESIREIIVNIFDEYYEQPFADVSYGYCITTDSSQGSTYSQVFIDGPDMLDQTKYPFLDISVAKRRFYTAVTRTSEKVNILI